ncbi:metalloprotease [Brazilian porcupinepox virus 1]|nr:metalloprotease [Brazilian porcupinepox virus 1]
MIVLSNGVRIFINNDMEKDIYLGISGFGFENDINEVIGIAHLLEHILIVFNSSRFIANASTARSYMSFWCKSIKGRSSYKDSIKTLISWFYTNGKLKDCFNISNIESHINELENEYYFRNEVFHCIDILTFLSEGDLYNGGRLSMLDDIDYIKKMLYNRMHRIIGPNVVIFVKELDSDILELFNQSFGTLPLCPLTIPYNNISTVNGKIAMIPSPFYTIMINIKPTINNILSIICLYEIYHLVEYETINSKLYITISFVNEKDYENFLRGTGFINLCIEENINLKHCDDFLMNMYLCFPSLRHDVLDYLIYINNNMRNMFKSLENEMRLSILQGNYIAIYPNFSEVIFNKNDRQHHKIVILDSLINIENNNIQPIDLMKKQLNNKIHLNYSDTSLIDYVSFALCFKSNILRREDGLCIEHRFSPDDMKTILESDTFLKYSKSKPAPVYQYIILSFFVTENSIDDIINDRESVVSFYKPFKHKILFGKKSRYDITTYSNFVAGIIKGDVTDEKITEIMWDLKKKGLIYSLDFTRIGKKIFYLFMFSIYPDDVFSYIESNKNIKSHCLVVSKKGKKEDFSSMKKDIIVKLN